MSASPSSTPDRCLERIRAEYLEMPGLHLTGPQVERLCGLEHAGCQIALDALVETRFLRVKPDGAYARMTDTESGKAKANAELR